MMINVNSHAFKPKYLKLNQVNQEQNNQRVKSDNISFGADRKGLVKYGIPVALGLSLLTGCRENSLNSVTMSQPQPQAFTPSAESIEYFKDVAGRSEFGGAHNIRKWPQGELRLCVGGQQNPEDKQELETRIIPELNQLIAPSNQIVQSCEAPQIELQYMPASEMSGYFGDKYIPGNLGFFWTSFKDSKLTNAKIAIESTKRVTQRERNHLLREELTQTLGLMADSNKYPNSIFYQGWTDINDYAEIDRDLIRMLYHPSITPGMSAEQAASILAGSSIPVATLPDAASQTAPGVNPTQITAPAPQTTISQESRAIIRNLGQRARNIDWANVAVKANNTLRRINGETVSSPQPQAQSPYYTPGSTQAQGVPVQSPIVQGLDPASVGQGNALSGGSVDACYTTPNPALCIQTYNDTLRSQ